MRYSRLAALAAAAALLVTACGGGTPAPSTAAPTGTPAASEAAVASPTVAPIAYKACMVSDTGGIDDHAFNENAWKGMTDAQAKTGVQVKFLESNSESDYAKNINQFISEKCDMIVTVGFLLGDATKAAAAANPNTRFAIVDYAYTPAIPNVEGLVYTTAEGAMLAGYASASWSKTHTMGTFGGINIGGPVTDFMDGFVAGAHYYDKQKGTKTTVLGWDPVKKTGSFTGDFSSIDNGKTLSLGFLDENADVIMGVGGPIGQGAFAAIQERSATAVGLGVDVDWYISVPQYKSLILTSVLKKIDVSVEAAVERGIAGTAPQAVFVSTLANGGVGYAPFHDYDSQITADTKTELDALQQAIIAGTVKPSDYFAAP
ncbi:MAG: BMP family ABC transporter substrate-binding protein [Chloroflexi bacterium]|nr:BMP family ABC transporter substrate-binding protein [Chloroflexota bacterium]